MVHGVLAGLLLLVAWVWMLYAHNRLWQQSLRVDLSQVLEVCAGLGLVVEEPGFAPCVVVSGPLNGKRVQIEWRGGARQARTLLRVDGNATKHPLVVDGAGVRQLLAKAGVDPV